MLPIFTDIEAMKTTKRIEAATDQQLRDLCRRFAHASDLYPKIMSSLPLLTVERAQLINLLKYNDIGTFLQ